MIAGSATGKPPSGAFRKTCSSPLASGQRAAGSQVGLGRPWRGSTCKADKGVSSCRVAPQAHHSTDPRPARARGRAIPGVAQLVSAETVQQTTSDIKIPAVSAATVSLTSAVMMPSIGSIMRMARRASNGIRGYQGVKLSLSAKLGLFDSAHPV